MGAYAEMAGRPWEATVWRCLRASAGDAALTVVVLLATVRLAPRPPRTYVAAAALAAVTATLVEWTAVSTGRWSYTERMPVVALLDIGLWPVLQLAVQVPAALWAATRGYERLP